MICMDYVRAREGDFIETVEGLIFDVKGLVHPPNRVVAYLRYVKDSRGNRVRGSSAYRKVYSLSEREKLLKLRYPRYIFYDPVFGENLQGVPVNLISVHYQPAGKVSELLNRSDLDSVEAQALEFVQGVHDESGVSFKKLGISGSLLVGLHAAKSDIDLIVYGRRNSIAVYDALARLMRNEKSHFSQYDLDDLKRLYEFRLKDTEMRLEDFLRLEKRKKYQGKFRGRDFFVRFILDWDEMDERYGDRRYVPSGYARIRAEIEDDSESIFTPCVYGVSKVQILSGTEVSSAFMREMVSFRGRFCEQAFRGETVIAQGKVEKVIEKDGSEYFRLVLGAKPSDYMITT